MVNAVMRKDEEVEVIEQDRAPLSLQELRDGIEGDYQVRIIWRLMLLPSLCHRFYKLCNQAGTWKSLPLYLRVCVCVCVCVRACVCVCVDRLPHFEAGHVRINTALLPVDGRHRPAPV
jgi:hypothetical protein